jgi:hypothetical protein
VTISYVLPAGLTTASASLFVSDAAGDDCGQAAWSSCPVQSHDDFFEPVTGDHGGGDLLADADDYVSPAPGASVTPGAELSATYYDETQFNPARMVFQVDGVTPPFQITNDKNASVAPPVDNASITGDNTIGTPATGVSQVSSPGRVSGSSASLTVTVLDYLGDPLPGVGVAATSMGSSAAGGSAVSDGQGNATINVTDSVKEAAAFSVSAAGSLGLGTVWVGFNNKTVGGNPTSAGGNPPMVWTTDLNPHGSSTDAAGKARTNSDYLVKLRASVPTSNGWHSAFIYTYDLDQNQAGGDCTFTQFAFKISGGSPASQRSLSLVQ